jgi:hypothetical protein
MAIQIIKYIEQIKKKTIDFRMKNAHLNCVFISRLYLHTIQYKKKTQQKYIINKTKKK